MTTTETMTQTFLDSHPELLGDTDLNIKNAAQGFAVDHYAQYGADGFATDLLDHARGLLSVVRPFLGDMADDLIGGMNSTFILPQTLTDSVCVHARGTIVLRGLYLGLVTALLMEGSERATSDAVKWMHSISDEDLGRAGEASALRCAEWSGLDRNEPLPETTAFDHEVPAEVCRQGYVSGWLRAVDNLSADLLEDRGTQVGSDRKQITH